MKLTVKLSAEESSAILARIPNATRYWAQWRALSQSIVGTAPEHINALGHFTDITAHDIVEVRITHASLASGLALAIERSPMVAKEVPACCAPGGSIGWLSVGAIDVIAQFASFGHVVFA